MIPIAARDGQTWPGGGDGARRNWLGPPAPQNKNPAMETTTQARTDTGTAGKAGATVTERTTLSKIPGASALRGNGPHAVSVDGVDLILLRTGGHARVYQGRCPHQGALLGEGELDGGELVCRNHRWRFDAETGRRV